MNIPMMNVKFSIEDDCFIVTSYDYSGLSAHGDTITEAVNEFCIALLGYNKVLERIDNEISFGRWK